MALSKSSQVAGISVICHGIDVWGSGRAARRRIESYLMGRKRVRMVAVSNFTAGALWRAGPAAILPPGLSGGWFQTLIDASAAGRSAEPQGGQSIVTAFRLSQWRDKGLPELIRAVSDLGHLDIRLTVCGSGPVPPELERLVRAHPLCRLRAGLTDGDLAQELASADLFVLATRSRRGKKPSGEGFGLVLIEAQVAGTPVVGPAHAGSHDAFIDGITGVAPTDETAAALARIIGELMGDPARLRQMGCQAARWARSSFAPDLYASQAVARLL
jgi:glycosyltransferase involved in cell wall biosynthesis